MYQYLQITIIIFSIWKVGFKSERSSGNSILERVLSASNIIVVYIHFIICTIGVHTYKTIENNNDFSLWEVLYRVGLTIHYAIHFFTAPCLCLNNIECQDIWKPFWTLKSRFFLFERLF